MTIRGFIAGILVHWCVGLGAFLWLNGVAIASADAGQGLAGLDVLGIAVHYALLQPLAHWVLAAVPLAWWTWPGLAGLAALLLVNSVLSALILISAFRLLGR